jgi:hypothetical protein
MMHFRTRPICQAAVLLLVCAFRAAPVGSTSSFTFSGVCSDCSNDTGTLVLSSYTQGTAITSGNFVSLTYSSSKISFTLTSAESPSVSGSLPVSLPAAASVNIVGPGGKVLQTQLSGSWCAGNACDADFGTAGTWTAVAAPAPPATPPSGAPALNDWMLITLAAAMAVMGGILVKKSRTRFSA